MSLRQGDRGKQDQQQKKNKNVSRQIDQETLRLVAATVAAMAAIRDQYLIVLSKLPVTTTFISLTKWIDLSRMERAERTQREQSERPAAAPAVQRSDSGG